MSTLRERWVLKKQAGQRLAALTAYDYAFARLLDEAGLDVLLVGDSLGMVHLGRADTVSVTLAEMVHHTRAAAAGVKHTLLVADLPRESSDAEAAILEGARALVDAGAAAVKIEGGTSVLAGVQALAGEGIAVVGHLGMLPQRVREEGGYRIKGRTVEEARLLLEEARALDAAGVAAIVLELVEPQVAADLTAAITVPTIGIGSGDACDGEILVTHDLLGLFPWFRPRFVRPLADLAPEVVRAARAFGERVRARA